MTRSKAAMIVGAAALWLGGCATFPQSYAMPPGATAEMRNQAYADCKARADRAPILAAEADNWTLLPKARDNLLVSCMEQSGFRLDPDFRAAL
jgi:hypothetical protein